MKALKTIVATAVIVFALTTVAMAGARHVGSWSDAATPAAGPTAAQTHQNAGLTLTDGQFARLLRAVDGQAAKLHTTQADRETSRDRARDHSRNKASDSTPIQEHARHSAQTPAHSGGTHDGGGTHHNGGTHDGGTPHDGGTHHGGTCNE